MNPSAKVLTTFPLMQVLPGALSLTGMLYLAGKCLESSKLYSSLLCRPDDVKGELQHGGSGGWLASVIKAEQTGAGAAGNSKLLLFLPWL